MPSPTPPPIYPSNQRLPPLRPPPPSPLQPRAQPKSKPTPSLPTTLADLSSTELARYRNRRTWIFSIAIFGLVGSSVLIGAGLKEEWQRRKLRKLRELEKGIVTGSTAVGEGEGSSGQGQGQEKEEEIAVKDEAGGLTWTQRDTIERRKLVKEQIENLEARRNELVVKRGEIMAKVERLQERMRKREAEREGRERMSKEGGEMVRVER